MAKLSKKALSAMGKEITTIAKQIRKENPKKNWTTCMKLAGRKYRQAHK